MIPVMYWEDQLGYENLLHNKAGHADFNTWARDVAQGPEPPAALEFVKAEAFISTNRWLFKCGVCFTYWPVPRKRDLVICGRCSTGIELGIETFKADFVERFPAPSPHYAPLRHWHEWDTAETVQARYERWVAQGRNPYAASLSIGATTTWTAGQVLRDSDMITYLNNPINDLAGRNGDIEFEDDLKPDAGKSYILPNSNAAPSNSISRNSRSQLQWTDSGGNNREVFDFYTMYSNGGNPGDLVYVSSTASPHKASGDTRTLRQLQRLARPTSGTKVLENNASGRLRWVDAPSGGGSSTTNNYNINIESSAITSGSSGGNWSNSGLSVAIRPSSSSSKVLIMISGGKLQNTSETVTYGPNQTGIGVRIRRGSNTRATYNFRLPTRLTDTLSLMYLDSPSTTSSTTYTMQWREDPVSTVSSLSAASSYPLTMTAIEIR